MEGWAMVFPLMGFFRICSELQQKITKIQLFPTTGTEKWGKTIQVHSWHPSPCDQAPPNQLKKRLNGKAPGTKFIRKLMSFILAIKPSYVCLISQVLQEPGQVHLPSRELPYTFQRNLWDAGLWHWPPSAARTWERAGRGSAAFPGLANASTASPDSQHRQDCYCPASACSHCSPHKNTQQTQEISNGRGSPALSLNCFTPLQKFTVSSWHVSARQQRRCTPTKPFKKELCANSRGLKFSELILFVFFEQENHKRERSWLNIWHLLFLVSFSVRWDGVNIHTFTAG